MENLEIEFDRKNEQFRYLMECIVSKLQAEGLCRSNYTTNRAVKKLIGCVAGPRLVDLLIDNEAEAFRSLPKYETDKDELYYRN